MHWEIYDCWVYSSNYSSMICSLKILAFVGLLSRSSSRRRETKTGRRRTLKMFPDLVGRNNLAVCYYSSSELQRDFEQMFRFMLNTLGFIASTQLLWTIPYFPDLRVVGSLLCVESSFFFPFWSNIFCKWLRSADRSVSCIGCCAY